MASSPGSAALVLATAVLTAAAYAVRLYHLALLVAPGGGAQESGEGGAGAAAPQLDAVWLEFVFGRSPLLGLPALLTTNFVERQFLPLVATLLVFWTGGRYIERMWGTRRYLRLVCGTLLATTLARAAAAAAAAALNVAVGKPVNPVHISGAAAGVAAVLVALRRLLPEHTIRLPARGPPLRIRWLPTTFLFIVTLLRLAGLYNELAAAWAGFLVAWAYLRFYERVPDAGRGGRRAAAWSSSLRVRGDASDAFALAQFFPEPAAGLVERATAPLGRLARALRLVPSFTAIEIESANQRYAARLSGNVLPFSAAGARMTNERRKMLETLV